MKTWNSIKNDCRRFVKNQMQNPFDQISHDAKLTIKYFFLKLWTNFAH